MTNNGQVTKFRTNITENFNRLSMVSARALQTDDRQTDGRATAYSKRECERERSSLLLKKLNRFEHVV